MWINKLLVSITILLLNSGAVSAELTELIEEDEISKWGYITIEYRLANNETHMAEFQTIKSIIEAPGLKNYYYSYVLILECFPAYHEAYKKRLNLMFTGEKEYILSELEGKCVRAMDTSAKFSASREQKRIFLLFNEYLDNYSHNNSLKSGTPKNGAPLLKRFISKE